MSFASARFALCLSLLSACLLVAASGCGSNSKIPVSGKVTFDGTPVKEGRILFRMLEGDKRGYSGTITDGAYTVECPAGPMRVEITASRPIPGKFDESNPGEKVPVGEMYIPDQYNKDSTLKVEVSSSAREFPFDLKSKS